VRAFTCDVCGNLLVFENSVCVVCGTSQGFSPRELRLVPVPDDGNRVRCANLHLAACNWLADAPGALCLSCSLTRTRPHDGDQAGLAAFAATEQAKRRLVYQLLDLALPVVPPSQDPNGLAFDLLSSAEEPVITGHADGLVTIDLAEGQDAHREAMRVQMGEPYRTLLGHLRHEVGHYYWQVLVEGRCPDAGRDVGRGPAEAGERPWMAGRDSLAQFRFRFGDETADYADALQRHYSQGPPANWNTEHVSAYATAHPWEDWAETFAHYLHIGDTLQIAAAYGMLVTGPEVPAGELARGLVALPMDGAGPAAGVRDLVATWLPLTLALNAVNRSMGKDDLYPFVLSEPVIAKLGFVHSLVAGTPS
jgi:hypothetical protein